MTEIHSLVDAYADELTGGKKNLAANLNPEMADLVNGCVAASKEEQRVFEQKKQLRTTPAELLAIRSQLEEEIKIHRPSAESLLSVLPAMIDAGGTKFGLTIRKEYNGYSAYYEFLFRDLEPEIDVFRDVCGEGPTLQAALVDLSERLIEIL